MRGQYHLHVHNRQCKTIKFSLSRYTIQSLFQEFDRGRSFVFLADIMRQFVAEYGLTVATAIAYGMNTEFSQVLAIEMRRYSEETSTTIMNQVQGQIQELKGIMVQNIENVAGRGERIELLVNKTDNLRNSVSRFGDATNVREALQPFSTTLPHFSRRRFDKRPTLWPE